MTVIVNQVRFFLYALILLACVLNAATFAAVKSDAKEVVNKDSQK